MCMCDTSRDMIFRSSQLLQLTIGSARNLVVDFLFMFVLQCHRLLQVRGLSQKQTQMYAYNIFTT
jgi:hypothetical protein